MEPLRLCSVEPLNYSELFSFKGDSWVPLFTISPILFEISRFFGLDASFQAEDDQALISAERYMASSSLSNESECVHICLHLSGDIEDSIASMFSLASERLDATLILVASTLCDNAIKKLQWLDAITIDSVKVCGLELNFWRTLDTNRVLPFVSSSLDEKGSQRQLQILGQEIMTEQTEQAVNGEPLQVYTEFWLAFNNELLRRKSAIVGQKPVPRNWVSYPINDDFSLVASLNPAMESSAIGLVISGRKSQAYYEQLIEMRETIECELTMPASWQAKPEREICRIFVRHYGFDFTNKAQWPVLHKWLASMLEKFQTAFELKINALYLQDRFDITHETGLKHKMGWDAAAGL